jgi:16S rRNA (guanine1207-N2)-methyltransferase
MSSRNNAVYGSPSTQLVEIEEGALQVSPLVLGSAEIERIEDQSLDSFTLEAPPGTIERRYAIAMAIRTVTQGRPIVVLGPKHKGGTRVRKELEGFGCLVEEESKAHYKICRTLCPQTPTALNAAILEGAPRFEQSLGMHTQPGVFSWDRIDQGSAILLSQLPALAGRGADFGAGLGVLSLAAFGDSRALACSKKNLQNEQRARFLRVDLRTANLSHDYGLGNLDFILMNPPFHDAGAEDRSLGLKFLSQAAHALRPGGSAWIVANRHLPYEKLIQESFFESKLLVEKGGFKIFRAIR